MPRGDKIRASSSRFLNYGSLLKNPYGWSFLSCASQFERAIPNCFCLFVLSLIRIAQARSPALPAQITPLPAEQPTLPAPLQTLLAAHRIFAGALIALRVSEVIPEARMLFVPKFQRMIALSAAIIPTVVYFLPQLPKEAACCPNRFDSPTHVDDRPSAFQQLMIPVAHPLPG